MPENIINCQNLTCPQPVLHVKSFIETHPQLNSFSILLDNLAAVENVSRLLSLNGYVLDQSEEDGVWTLSANRNLEISIAEDEVPATFLSPKEDEAEQSPGKTLVLIAAPVIGLGDDVLGEKLMGNFLSTLPEIGVNLWRVILLNGGVTLAVANSPVIEHLKRIEELGVSIFVCGTCLEFFGLSKNKYIGETTNMLDVITSLQLADKVIKF